MGSLRSLIASGSIWITSSYSLAFEEYLRLGVAGFVGNPLTANSVSLERIQTTSKISGAEEGVYKAVVKVGVSNQASFPVNMSVRLPELCHGASWNIGSIDGFNKPSGGIERAMDVPVLGGVGIAKFDIWVPVKESEKEIEKLICEDFVVVLRY